MVEKILDSLENSYPLLALFILLLCGLVYLMYLISKGYIEKIDSNIEKVETRLMTSIINVKTEMIQNAKDIKVGVDKDVVILKSEQDGLSKQQDGLSKQQDNLDKKLSQVEHNIHSMNKNMVNMQHEVRTMSGLMKDVNHTLTLMHIQMGGDLKQAIKGSIDNLED